ncbi:UPF0489 family protein [Aliifodinibius sp. S!AR15-10]|uniref:hypothetical protein n=1 Tax=Aliifodinibius sp. S!AR15-10 TaxID=2950437 RepID=UPI002866F3FF|nr:hypothetical protein [Aliifodinibius sp. S!AR15-10]MDR8390353.1 UPF0489 family protein [Aliifodinibius sp. S!AR15-10]
MHRDPKISETTPFGAHSEMVAHPGGKSEREVELAIFKDHRYSFFYWLKWTRLLQESGQISESESPTLVTIDWHRDLAPPSDSDKEALNSLNQQDLEEVRDFTVYQLDPHNDGHVLSAAWLNVIGDIILLKNYGMEQKDHWTDRDGHNHQIMEFTSIDTFQSEITARDGPMYLDIDLDYFIKNKVAPYQRTDVQIYKDEEIESVIDPQNPLFQHILKYLEGITLASEPRYCGGIRNSNHILEVILNQLFTQDMEWRQ